MIDKKLVDNFVNGAVGIAKSHRETVRVYPVKDGYGWYYTSLNENRDWVLQADKFGNVELAGEFKDAQYVTNAFMICPVRGVEYPDGFLGELTELEEKYHVKIHFPPRDTNQDDSTGLRICHDNRKAIEASDVVFVLWDDKSRGTLFDLGMAFAMGKRIMILNRPEPTDGKSFQNMILGWEAKSGN